MQLQRTVYRQQCMIKYWKIPMAKTKHQKLADLMETMLKAIEKHPIETRQLLESMQLCLLERHSFIDPKMMGSEIFPQPSQTGEGTTESLSDKICVETADIPKLEQPMLYDMFHWKPISIENSNLERSCAQALLFCPQVDEISNEIDWFEAEMAADSFTYQLLSVQEYIRQQAIISENLLKEPFPSWEEAKKECLRRLE
jgi:hypothetical protein